MTTSAVVKFDGGARPNPGPAAIGYLVETDNWTKEGSDHIGESTNNRAEYRALIQGLEVTSEKSCVEVMHETHTTPSVPDGLYREVALM